MRPVYNWSIYHHFREYQLYLEQMMETMFCDEQFAPSLCLKCFLQKNNAFNVIILIPPKHHYYRLRHVNRMPRKANLNLNIKIRIGIERMF